MAKARVPTQIMDEWKSAGALLDAAIYGCRCTQAEVATYLKVSPKTVSAKLSGYRPFFDRPKLLSILSYLGRRDANGYLTDSKVKDVLKAAGYKELSHSEAASFSAAEPGIPVTSPMADWSELPPEVVDRESLQIAVTLARGIEDLADMYRKDRKVLPQLYRSDHVAGLTHTTAWYYKNPRIWLVLRHHTLGICGWLTLVPIETTLFDSLADGTVCDEAIDAEHVLSYDDCEDGAEIDLYIASFLVLPQMHSREELARRLVMAAAGFMENLYLRRGIRVARLLAFAATERAVRLTANAGFAELGESVGGEGTFTYKRFLFSFRDQASAESPFFGGLRLMYSAAPVPSLSESDVMNDVEHAK